MCAIRCERIIRTRARARAYMREHKKLKLHARTVMYPAELHRITIKTVADLFECANGRNRAMLAAAITPRGILASIDLIENYIYNPTGDATAEVAIGVAAGMYDSPVNAGGHQLCFTLAQLCSLLLFRADLVDQFRQLLLSHKVYATCPTGVISAGGKLMLTY